MTRPRRSPAASKTAREWKQVTIRSRAAWRSWLSQHHEQNESIWLVTHKKGSGRPHVSYVAIVEEALCFGWVDSLPRKLDEQRSMLLLSPRRAGSNWSALNKQRAAALIEAGLMTAAGLAAIERAQRDGTWSALDAVEALTIPDDLHAALAANPRARGHFEAFPRSVKRGILEWIHGAKRPATRAARIAKTVSMAERNERANHPRQPVAAARKAAR